ncbi:Sporulation related domain protein [compost metagenome]
MTATFGSAEIVEARVRGVTVYRVQTGSFTDRAKADDERMRARRAGFDAIVVEK